MLAAWPRPRGRTPPMLSFSINSRGRRTQAWAAPGSAPGRPGRARRRRCCSARRRPRRRPTGAVEGRAIGRVDVAGERKARGRADLDQVQHDGAGAAGDHGGELVEVPGAARGDRIGKLGEAGLPHQMDVLDLHIAGRPRRVFEQKIDPRVRGRISPHAGSRRSRRARGSRRRASAAPTSGFGWAVLTPTSSIPPPRSTSTSSQL